MPITNSLVAEMPCKRQRHTRLWRTPLLSGPGILCWFWRTLRVVLILMKSPLYKTKQKVARCKLKSEFISSYIPQKVRKGCIEKHSIYKKQRDAHTIHITKECNCHNKNCSYKRVRVCLNMKS